jgi:hypothetical protein
VTVQENLRNYWKLRGVVISHSFAFRASRRLKFSYKSIENACTVVVLRADIPGKAAQWFAQSIPESWVRVVVSSSVIKAWERLYCIPLHTSQHAGALPATTNTSTARRRTVSSKYSSCTAFPSTLVSMLELSPPLPILLPRVGGLSALSTRAVNCQCALPIAYI